MGKTTAPSIPRRIAAGTFPGYGIIFRVLIVWFICSPQVVRGDLYTIHVKTVSSYEQAKAVISRLSRKGYPSFYRHMPSFEKGLQYRVYIGKYPTKEAALKDLNELWNQPISDHYAIAILKEKFSTADQATTRPPTASSRPQSIPAAEQPKPSSPTAAEAASDKKEVQQARILEEALALFHRQQYNKALPLFNRLADQMESADLLFWIGICHAQNGAYHEAEEKLRLFLAGKPNSPQAALELAAVQYQQNNRTKSLVNLKKAEAFQPSQDTLRIINRLRKGLKTKEEEDSSFWDFFRRKKKPNNQPPDPQNQATASRQSGRFYIVGTDLADLMKKTLSMDAGHWAAAYYLGFLQVRERNPLEAIRFWNRYLSKAPDNERSAHLRKQRILQRYRYAAAAFLKSRSKRKPVPPAGSRDTIVIAEFRNRCSADLPGIGKGLAELLIFDLQKQARVTVADRILVEALVKKDHPDQIPISSQKDAVHLGRHLQARFVVWGEFTDISENAFHFQVTITDAQKAAVVDRIDLKGTRSGWSVLEKRLLFGILEAIRIHKKDFLPKERLSIEEPLLTRFAAFQHFSMGWEYLDRQRFTLARGAFQIASDMDPTFTVARIARQSTPTDIAFSPFFHQTKILRQIKGEKRK